MKKMWFRIYTLFRVLWLPIVFVTPIITIEQTSPVSYELNFPVFVIIPLLIVELVLRRKYRKDFSRLSTKYWIITALITWVITVGALLLSLPGMPFHKDWQTPLQSTSVIVVSIILATFMIVLSTLPEIMSRKKTVSLYKKEELFK
jgi:uncharacterized membrane protein